MGTSAQIVIRNSYNKTLYHGYEGFDMHPEYAVPKLQHQIKAALEEKINPYVDYIYEITCKGTFEDGVNFEPYLKVIRWDDKVLYDGPLFDWKEEKMSLIKNS